MVGFDCCGFTVFSGCLKWLALAAQHRGTGCASCTSTAWVPCPHVHACRGFKALKQVVKLHYRLNQKDKMLASYRWAVSGASTAASSNLFTHCSFLCRKTCCLASLATCCRSDVLPQPDLALVHQWRAGSQSESLVTPFHT